MNKFQVCEPNNTYIIVEQIHPKISLLGHNFIGKASFFQVYRRVIQVCEIQHEFKFDGRPIRGIQPSTLQILLDMLSRRDRITSKPSGDKQLVLMYAGFKNTFQPLPKASSILPEAWTRQYSLGTPPSPFIFGRDPVPNIRLYGDPGIPFVMPGGAPPASAIVIYDKGKNLITKNQGQSEIELMLKKLLKPSPFPF